MIELTTPNEFLKLSLVDKVINLFYTQLKIINVINSLPLPEEVNWENYRFELQKDGSIKAYRETEAPQGERGCTCGEPDVSRMVEHHYDGNPCHLKPRPQETVDINILASIIYETNWANVDELESYLKRTLKSLTHHD